MKITFHVGAHKTDDGMLLKSLQRNRRKLAAEGTLIPEPATYRDMLRDLTTSLAGAPASPHDVDRMLAAMIDELGIDHVVLSFDNFLCAPNKVTDGGYYAKAGPKSTWLRQAFPGCEVAFALGLRNPATQVPAMLASMPNMTYEAFMAGLDPRQMRWPPAIAAVRDANPGCQVIVWSNEDTPLIWPEVMREVTASDPFRPFKGGFDVLAQIMDPEGMERLRAYLKAHPPENEIQRRRVLAAFLDKYAMDEAVEEVIDLPGWTAPLVERITQNYEDDLLALQSMPGVSFIAP
jgi:hypothetical protein